MRIVIIGDKSKYQFFRSLNPVGNNNMFDTESLAKHDLIVSSTVCTTNGNTFFSYKVPLHTELIFVSEFKMETNPCKDDDKLLIFDEFPFRTETEIYQMKQYIQHNNVTDCTVIIVDNNIDTLETDVTNISMAIADAVKMYRSEGLQTSIYDMRKKNYDFLYYSINPNYSIPIHRKAIEFLNEARVKLDTTFDICFKTALLFDLNIYPSSAELINLWRSIAGYDRKMKQTTIFKVLEDKICNELWNNNKYLSFVTNFYKKQVEAFLGPYVKWNIEEDLSKLEQILYGNCYDYIHCIHACYYAQSEIEYRKFSNEHSDEMLELESKIFTYLTDHLGQIIKERLIKRIDQLIQIVGAKNEIL